MSASVRSEDPLRIALCLDELSQGLALKRLGGQLHYFPEIDSTNSFARQLADNGAREGEIVIAETQTHGRGRLGRRWQSPPFTNLYFSVILRPQLLPANAPQITLMAAVALAETVAALITQGVAIKWPNDILVEGKKLAGILTEAACDPERLQYVLLGIGVNLNYRIDTMPEEIRRRATSLAELTGNMVSREGFFRRLIHALDRCYGELEEVGFARLAPRWEAHFELRGKQVRVESFDQSITGTALGIDQDGALLIEDPQGARQRVLAGDVIPVGN